MNGSPFCWGNISNNNSTGAPIEETEEEGAADKDKDDKDSEFEEEDEEEVTEGATTATMKLA